MKNLLVLGIVVVCVLALCSSKDAKIRSEFMAACTQSGSINPKIKEICSCTYDKVRDHLGVDKMVAVENDPNLQREVMRLVIDFQPVCMKETPGW